MIGYTYLNNVKACIRAYKCDHENIHQENEQAGPQFLLMKKRKFAYMSYEDLKNLKKLNEFSFCT